jgi:hypothetical protein
MLLNARQIGEAQIELLDVVLLGEFQGFFGSPVSHSNARPSVMLGRAHPQTTDVVFLELIPQILVVNLVVILHFLRFDDGAEQSCTAIG